jgi:Tol biopolymer transport system component
VKRAMPGALILAATLSWVAAAIPAHAAYPGQNGKIVFLRDFDSVDLQLFTMEPDGSAPTSIYPTGGKSPSWSPDGRRIAFQGCPNVNLPSCGIWVIDADKGNAVQLTSTRFDAVAGDGPSWSPDGTKLAFTRGTVPCGDPACGGDVHVMNADGTGIVNITNDPAEDQDPAWSPDGELIAFRSDRGGDEEIYVMEPDGTDVRRLTDATAGASTFDSSPDWAPDGSSLVFARNMAIGPVDSELFTINRDGTGETRITFDPRLNGDPAWSPDGTKIVMTTALLTELRDDIEVIGADGSNPTVLTSGRERDVWPDWQPIPSRPPDCSPVRPSRAVLWPPNRMFRSVALGGGTDPDGDPVTLAIDAVTQDEPVRAPGDPTFPDARAGGEADTIQLRAERNPRGDGRVYRIAFTLSDDRGLGCTGDVPVAVPRHRDRAAVDSAPPSYDSPAP